MGNQFLNIKDAAVAVEPSVKSAISPALVNIVQVQRVVPVRDNSEFTIKFDKNNFKGIIKRPTKTIIVDQDPDTGEFVPAGTPINITLTVKDSIPVGSFKDVVPEIAVKFPLLGDMLADIGKPDDDSAKAAKSVLDKNVDYEALPTNDKMAVDKYMAGKFGEDTVSTPEKKTSVYNNVKFLYHL